VIQPALAANSTAHLVKRNCWGHVFATLSYDGLESALCAKAGFLLLIVTFQNCHFSLILLPLLQYPLGRPKNRWDNNIIMDLTEIGSRDISVGIATGYRLGGPGSIPSSSKCFHRFLHRVETGPGAHVASCSMGTGSSFPGGKAAGA
jgi:hypothetical protein